MIKRFNRSLRFKLSILLMITMAFAVMGSVLITKLFVNTYFLSQLKHKMIGTYESINSVFQTDGLKESEIKNHLAKIAAKGDMNIFILREDGTVYTNANEKTNMWNSLDSIARLLLAGKDEDNLSDLFDVNNGGYYIFHQNYDETLDANFYDLVGVLDDGSLIAIRSSVLRFDESVSSTMNLYMGVCFVAILIGSIAMFLVSSAYVKPIHEMAKVAKRMSQLDFDAKVTRTSKDEIGELGHSINSMSEELEHTISELKTANAKLTKDIEEKTQIDEMRKEFLSHVSHELKTPITSIMGYADTLLEGDYNKETQDKFLNVIATEARRMAKLVTDLLTLSRYDSNKKRAQKESFDLGDLVKKCQDKLAIEIKKKNHTVNCFVTADVPPVYADKYDIERVVLNILTNSIKYTKDGGEIKIYVGFVYNDAYIKIFDNGIGIPEEDLSRIFERFYRVDKARTREMGGSGLGLAIAKEILDKNGGSIDIKSVVGQGTEVVVRIPTKGDRE